MANPKIQQKSNVAWPPPIETPNTMSFSDERRAEQEARAYQIAQQFAGEHVTRGIVRAILALVQAVESGDTATSTGPAAGARQVLQRNDHPPKKREQR